MQAREASKNHSMQETSHLYWYYSSTPLQIEQPVPQASMSILQLLLAKGWTNESTKILGCCTLLCRLEACRCRVSKWCPCSSRRHWLGWALFYSPQQLLERYPEVCIMLPSSQANNNNTCEVYDFFFFFSFSVSQSVFFFTLDQLLYHNHLS